MPFDVKQNITLADTRIYWQPAGPGPDNDVFLAGTADASYIEFTGVGNPERGGITTQKMHNPFERKSYVHTAEIIAAPGEKTASIKFYLSKGGVPRHAVTKGCRLSIYTAAGDCGDMTQMDTAWDSWLKVVGDGLIGEVNEGDFHTATGVDPLATTVTATFKENFYVGALAFGVVGQTNITTEVIDVTYGCKKDCGDCGPENDGTRYIYALCKAVAAAKPYIVYSTDYGATDTILSLVAAVADELPTAIEVVGNYLVVVSPTAQAPTNGGVYVSELDVNGVPGAFVKVTAGFVLGSSPSAMTVLGRTEAYISGIGGVIYKMTNPLAGVTIKAAGGSVTANDLIRITSKGGVILASGAAGTIIRSVNRGMSFAVITPPTPLASSTIVSGGIVTDRLWWIGGGTVGRMYYTKDAGVSWKERTFNASGTGALNDILIVNKHVMYFTHTVGGVVTLYASSNGGNTFTNILPRFVNFPAATFAKGNRLASPQCAGDDVTVGNILVAGLGLATDGQLVKGTGVYV